MKDVMLDLETMGTGPNAAIVAIGAVEFGELPDTLGRSFYRTVSLASSQREGLHIDASTVMWWLQQGDEAREALRRDAVDLVEALQLFAQWLDGSGVPLKERRIWGNGPSFDCVILANAYQACLYEVPWRYYNERCYRTAKDLLPAVHVPRTGTHHNALDDAKHQALVISAATARAVSTMEVICATAESALGQQQAVQA